jgi:hypothetical protein
MAVINLQDYKFKEIKNTLNNPKQKWMKYYLIKPMIIL